MLHGSHGREHGMSICDNCLSTVAINIDGSEHVALVTWQNIEKDTV